MVARNERNKERYTMSHYEYRIMARKTEEGILYSVIITYPSTQTYDFPCDEQFSIEELKAMHDEMATAFSKPTVFYETDETYSE